MKTKLTSFLSITMLALAALQVTGCRHAAAPVDGDTMLHAPSEVSGVALTSTQAQINWTNPNYVDVYYIKIEYKKAIDANYEVAATVSDVSQYLLTGLASSTDYNIRLQSVDVMGNQSEYSEIVSIDTASGITIKPVVNSISAVALPLSQIKVSWTWSNVNYDLLASYEVQRSPADLTDWDSLVTVSVGATAPLLEYIDTTASDEVKYRIKANYEAGGSSYSAISNSVDLFALPPPSSFYTYSEAAGFGGVYYLKTKWNYGVVDNVDYFTLVSTFKKEDGSIITTTTDTINYTAAASYLVSDLDTLATGGACDDDNLYKVEYKIQAVPVDATDNSASPWANTYFYCP